MGDQTDTMAGYMGNGNETETINVTNLKESFCLVQTI